MPTTEGYRLRNSYIWAYGCLDTWVRSKCIARSAQRAHVFPELAEKSQIT